MTSIISNINTCTLYILLGCRVGEQQSRTSSIRTFLARDNDINTAILDLYRIEDIPVCLEG